MTQKTIDGDDAIKPVDIVKWIGRGNYTIESFNEESKRLGACIRMGGGLPSDVIVGKSRIFLAHDWDSDEVELTKLWKLDVRTLKAQARKEGLELTDNVLPPKPELNGRIFAYFVINGILVVDADEKLEREGLAFQHVSGGQSASMEQRECGYPQVGASYFVSEDDMMSMQKDADMATGQITVLNDSIPFPHDRFRAFKYCDGDKILDGASLEEWFNIAEIRNHNTMVRREFNKRRSDEDKATEAKERANKPKRQTYRETLIEIFSHWNNVSKALELEAVIETATMKNKPLASSSRRVYRAVIGQLVKEGVLEMQQIDKEFLISVIKLPVSKKEAVEQVKAQVEAIASHRKTKKVTEDDEDIGECQVCGKDFELDDMYGTPPDIYCKSCYEPAEHGNLMPVRWDPLNGYIPKEMKEDDAGNGDGASEEDSQE